MFGLDDGRGLWLLRSDSTASARVVSELLDAGEQERLRAYSAALIKLAEGETSPEEVIGDLVIRTLQPSEVTRVNSEVVPRSGRSVRNGPDGGASNELSLGSKAVAVFAVAFLASSAISGYNPMFS
jgi:hypothetical protein